MVSWCLTIKAMKCQALYRNSVIKTRCHPLVTEQKRTYITATCWASSSISGKNPSKINLMNCSGRFCWTIPSINILAQIKVFFISRDKNLLTPKEHFQSCDGHPKNCLVSFLKHKYSEEWRAEHIPNFCFPTPCVFESPLETNMSCFDPGLSIFFLHLSY